MLTLCRIMRWIVAAMYGAGVLSTQTASGVAQQINRWQGR